ncbi:MAG: right-handed parallel beta-helix repeat-containing protein [Thermoanaerobaculia bacterium]
MSGVALPPRLLAVIGPLLLGAAAASAATFYVSPAGSDSNDGSPAAPFRQIRKAVAVSAPGDTVLVADGDYLGFDLEDMVGTASSLFTIQALGGNANVVKTTDRSDNRDTIRISFCSYVVLDGLRGSGANRAAVRVDQSDHVTVRNGAFGNNATWGIFSDFSDDLLLENNKCYGSLSQHGIYVSNSGDRPVVRGNRVHDNHASGIQLNADASQGGDGIISGAIIENNVIWNNGVAGGGAINLDGVHDSIVRNNLLYGNHASGITNFQIDGAEGPRGMQIVNNTIDMASDGRWALLWKSSTGANLVRNNILYNRNTNRGGIVYGDSTDVAGTDSDYNILDAVSPDDGGTRIVIAAWQGMGHEPHSFSATPASLFVNPAGADYHLLASSPAIDAGQFQSGAPLDLEGKARPVGPAFDIGCYEFAAPVGTSFHTVTPCRVVDTRSPAGPLGGPALWAGIERTFTLAGQCGVPPTARAVSVNVTVTQPTSPGDLRLFPSGTLPPLASTINYRAGQTRANNAIPTLGPSGGLTVRCDQAAETVHLVLDVSGYFQ